MKLHSPSDAELNAAFAEHVAGWKWHPRTPTEHGFMIACWRDTDGQMMGSDPRFTDSADAVLPYLEKHSPWRADCGGEYGYFVQVHVGSMERDHPYESANAPTIPRAAVIALLRAHGVEVEL